MQGFLYDHYGLLKKLPLQLRVITILQQDFYYIKGHYPENTASLLYVCSRLEAKKH
jgi:hypothetical protein